jgi:hypothetical protein
VSLLTGNTPEALAARYAANLAAARVVFLYDGMAPETLAQVVDSVDTRMLLVDPTRYRDAGELLPRVQVPAVLTLGPGPFGEDVLASSARRDPEPFAVPVTPGDDWCIRHTGGTTGSPKGIRMSHGPYRRSIAVPLANPTRSCCGGRSAADHRVDRRAGPAGAQASGRRPVGRPVSRRTARIAVPSASQHTPAIRAWTSAR